MKKYYFNLLLSPWVILSSVIIGVVIGIYNKPLAIELGALGDLYLKMLQMCVVPILVTAVVSSLGRLFSSQATGCYIRPMVLVFLTGLLLAAVFGVVVGLIGQPGTNLDQSAKVVLGKQIFSAESAGDVTQENTQSPGLMMFFQKMIPSNIFNSLTEGNNLAILFFSIFIGIALGMEGIAQKEVALDVVDAFYETFLRIVEWFMYALPFGLLCLIAGQIAHVGTAILGAMLKLIVLMYIGAFVMVVVYSLLIWMRVGGSYWKSLTALREPLFIALGTSSSFATIPSALTGLKEKLKLEKSITDLVVPLGITLNPPGTVFQFSLASIFIAQIYGAHLSLQDFIVLTIAAVLASMAASGAPGLAAVSMISLILEPLGLPVQVAVILLAAIEPIVDPMITVTNVYANCATSAIISNKQAEYPSDEEILG